MPPDCPGKYGHGLMNPLRAWERRPELKVLYTTGQGATDGMIAMFVTGSELLPKPYTVDQLQRSLATHFGFRTEAGVVQWRGITRRRHQIGARKTKNAPSAMKAKPII
jgi:hypothetical protein